MALGISDRHLRNLKDGPPLVRLGTAIVYPLASLERWLESRIRRSDTIDGGGEPTNNASGADRDPSALEAVSASGPLSLAYLPSTQRKAA